MNSFIKSCLPSHPQYIRIQRAVEWCLQHHHWTTATRTVLLLLIDRDMMDGVDDLSGVYKDQRVE